MRITAKKSIANAPALSLQRPVLARQGRFLLGAAIGTGMAAKAAERGGADFLLALSAGRFRSMGTPSAACMLALRDSNQMVMEFGPSEIVTQTSLPVFFGASLFGIDDFTQLLDRVAESGFHGITNCPSCIFLDGRYRQFLEDSGMGFDRELALLQAAQTLGLATLAYVHTLEEARCAALAHVDIVNLNFGWNMGGAVGVESSFGLEEVAHLAAQFVNVVRTVNVKTRCTIEGGPIITPEQMDEVCRFSNVDGYIGGSTIDRVPLESAVEMATGAFKTIGALRKQVDSLEKKLKRKATPQALIGFSESIDRARGQAARAMETDLPVFIIGEPGTGRREIAKVIHETRVGKGRWLIPAECKTDADGDMELTLFGCVAGARPGVEKDRTSLLDVARGSSLVLDDVGRLDTTVQRQLLQAVHDGGFLPRGGTQIVPLQVRFIGVTQFDPAIELHAKRFDTHFLQWLGTVRIELPPLRERLEDLPMLAEAVLREVSRGKKIRLDPSAYRTLLSHPWPGNLGELRSILQAAALASHYGVITDRILAQVLNPGRRPSSNRQSFSSEREWILDGLTRNRFRREETARFLQISRKTLYNKMQQYGLSGQGLPSKRARARRGK